MNPTSHQKKNKFFILRFLIFVLLGTVLFISLFFLLSPLFYAEKRLAWAFVWHIKQEIVPLIASLQLVSILILAVFFGLALRLHGILKKEKEELTSAVANLEVGFYREFPGEKGRILEVNEVILRMLDYKEEEFFKLKPKDIFADEAEYDRFVDLLFLRGTLIKEIRFKKKGSQSLWVLVSAKSFRNEHNEVLHNEYLVMDVSERKWMEEEMCLAYLRFESIIQNTPNVAVRGYDLDGKILEWNHAAEILYGYSKLEVINNKAPDLVFGKQTKDFEDIFLHMKNTGQPSAPSEWRIKNKQGRELSIYSSMFPISQGGKVIEIYCMDIDITDRVETEKNLNEIKNKLESLALKDPLTEIYNFRYFRERLAAEFERAKRTLSPISVLMLDLDYFKSINDSYGHQFGDKILKQVGRILKTELRTNDVVARWGGEEFAMILPDTNRTDAMTVSNKIIDLFRTRNFGDMATTTHLKCSIGVVSYPEDPLFSIEEIIDAGEECIYKVKERGGDGVALYGHEIEDKNLSVNQDSEEDRKRYVDAVKKKLSFYAVRSEHSILEAVYSLAKSIELRDRRTREHCDRMVEYAERMAKLSGMSDTEVNNVRRAAMLHDIGKIGISDAILLKPGKLTPEEYEIVKKHPVIGADIISVAGFLKDIVPLVLSHHERYDGLGYPRGLKGEEIQLGARILAVVDVYEAITSDRCYHKALSKDEAIKILKEGSGKNFDPKIVDLFLTIIA